MSSDSFREKTDRFENELKRLIEMPKQHLLVKLYVTELKKITKEIRLSQKNRSGGTARSSSRCKEQIRGYRKIIQQIKPHMMFAADEAKGKFV